MKWKDITHRPLHRRSPVEYLLYVPYGQEILRENEEILKLTNHEKDTGVVMDTVRQPRAYLDSYQPSVSIQDRQILSVFAVRFYSLKLIG